MRRSFFPPFALVVLPALASCASTAPSPMRPATTLDATAPTDAALVMFVRGANPCDEGSPFRIVDDASHFIGDSAPATKFAVRVTPGHHAFFAWQPFGDVPMGLYPNANQVGAVQGYFDAGHVYYVDVRITNSEFATRKTCFRYFWIGLRFQDPSTDQDMARALADAEPRAVDSTLAAHALDDSDSVARHVAKGMQKLNR